MMMITATSRMTTTNATTAIPAIAPVPSPVFAAPGGDEPENIRKYYILFKISVRKFGFLMLQMYNAGYIACLLLCCPGVPAKGYLPRGTLE